MVYMIAEGVGLSLSLKIQLPTIIASSLIIKFLLFNPIILYIILLISFIVLLIIHRFFYPILFVIGERTYALFANILENITGQDNITADNIILFWIFTILLVSFFTALIIFKFKKLYLLLPIYIIPFLYYWYNYYDLAYWMMSLFLLSFIMLMGLDRYTKVKSDIVYGNWIKTVTCYSILIVLLALILPKSYNYISWPWLQEKVYTYFPFVEELRSYDAYTRKKQDATLFDFSITGLQEGKYKLGGPIKLSDRKIMIVKSDEPLYLRGSVKHIYTGNSWKSHDMDYVRYNLRDRLNDLTYYDRRSYFEEKSITIKNLNFSTQTVFSPYLPDSFSFDKASEIYVNNDHVIIIPDGIYKYEAYTIRVQKPYPYGILLSKGIYNTKDNIGNIDIYLQVPEDIITKETRDLVKSIVKDKETDYDKAIAIEKYLRDNFEYSFDVEEVPEDAEFISHFLFKEKKGYCTYFATAMAIMLRLEGIPSRYVEGYIATEEVEHDIYEISNKNAHTWVEAFIEPIGWMTFEPTPAYPVENRMENYQTGEERENEPSLDTESSNEKENRVIERAPKDEINEGAIDRRDEANYNEDTYPENNYKERNNIGLIIGILIFIISTRLIIGFIYYKLEEIKFKKLTNNEKIIYLYQQIHRLTELFGYLQKYGETHYEYANRVANKFYYHNDKTLKHITHIFVKSKYSSYSSTDEEVKELVDFKYSLNKHLRNYWGLSKYIYRKYIKLDLKVRNFS